MRRSTIAGELVDDRQAHAAGASLDNLHSGFYVDGVQILDLGLSNLSGLRAMHTPDHPQTGGPGPFSPPRRFALAAPRRTAADRRRSPRPES